MLENLTDWATDIVERLGYLGVAMLVALENVFPPIPSASPATPRHKATPGWSA